MALFIFWILKSQLMALTFSDGVIHFLDIKISVNGIDIYCKDMHTGQYTHYSSKTAWTKSLFDCAFKICSTKTLLDNQIDILKSFMSWNGYPVRIRNFLINKLKLKYKSSPSTTIADLPKV